MIKSFAISLLACMALAPCAHAKHKCDSAPYTSVMPPHKGLTYGMTLAKAKRVLRKAYKSTGKGTLSSAEQSITVNLRSAHQKIFDQVYFRFTNGVLTRIAWSYSNKFQRNLGGIGDAFIALLTKIKDKVGGASSNTKEDGVIKFIWSAKQGLSIVGAAKDPNLIFIAFNCDTLEEEEQEKMRSSVNMGF